MKETMLVNLLIEKNYKIASAESLTGGMFASTIINVPNASKVLDASIVTYSNQSKTKFAEVKDETIEKFGVVSEEVAIEMAKGVASQTKANIGVSFSGIAGPAGGTKELPVGTVCMAISINEQVKSFTKHFSGSRKTIRKKSVKFMIDQLIVLLSK